MKDKILQIIRNEHKSIDATSIMNKIKEDYSTEELASLLKYLEELVHEGLIVSRKDGCFMPIERSKYKKGKIEITKSGSGFLLLPERDLHINRDRLNGAFDGDEVICEVVKDYKNEYEGKVKRIIKRSLGNSLAEVCLDKNGKVYLKMLTALPFNVELEGDTLGLLEGEIVKVESTREKSGTIYVNVTSKVGHKNAPDIDILKIVAEFDIPVEFSDEAKKEASLAPKEVLESDFEGRRDLRSKEIFTIDGADTKDIDDAISLEQLENGNYKLGVHIADVSYYVREGSHLKEEALLRGNSVYLADRVIPMLPVELSNGICSLNPNVDRCAMSIEMEIDSTGNVLNKELFRSIIKSRKKMTYASVNEIFNTSTPPDYKPFVNTLLKMRELANILKVNRTNRGDIDFLSSEIKLIVDSDGKVIDVEKRVQQEAEELIENFMIIANESVSEIMTEKDVPSIYRVHGAPSPKKIKDFLTFINTLGYRINGKINYDGIKPKDVQHILKSLTDKPNYETLNRMLLRCMQKAVYSPENIGHFGLASKDYTHFTSPIRRFSDLYLHYIISETIFKNANDKLINNIKNSLIYVTDHVSNTERIAEDCEHEVNDMKIAEYMEGKIGCEFEGIIDGTLKNGFFVETDNLISGYVLLETLDDYYTYKEDLMAYVNKKKQIFLRLGDRVRVKCINASKENRTVDFAFIKKV